VYAAGVLLYQLVTGKLPFRGDSAIEVILQHIERPPLPPRAIVPELNPELERIILTALAKQPDQRQASAQQLADEIAAVLPELDDGAPASAVELAAPVVDEDALPTLRILPEDTARLAEVCARLAEPSRPSLANRRAEPADAMKTEPASPPLRPEARPGASAPKPSGQHPRAPRPRADIAVPLAGGTPRGRGLSRRARPTGPSEPPPRLEPAHAAAVALAPRAPRGPASVPSPWAATPNAPTQLSARGAVLDWIVRFWVFVIAFIVVCAAVWLAHADAGYGTMP
jgi:serine/threonine-protein kinase